MPKNIGQEEFLKRAKEVHGKSYDYSRTEYVNQRTKVEIVCPIHGAFRQYPHSHIRKKHGCPVCGVQKQVVNSRNAKRMTKREDFVTQAKEKHGEMYDYSLLPDGFFTKDKVKIICPRHGIFEQVAGGHLTGRGCLKCKYNILTKNEFIEQAKKIHGDKYNYCKVDYKRMTEKVVIICHEHGDFLQMPSIHLRGSGCPLCKPDKIASKNARGDTELYLKDKTKWFVEESRKVHGDTYNYRKTVYRQSSKNVTITCKIHGDFSQSPNRHLSGSGCEKCGKDSTSFILRIPLEKFIKDSNDIHENKYDYSLVEIPKRMADKIKITCPIHGVFEQTMYSHRKGYGCPHCAHFSKGEKRIDEYLKKNGYDYERQYFIANESLFCFNRRMFVDFCIFIGNEKIFIEYNGKQHYEPVAKWGGTKKFEEQKKRDEAMKLYCRNHNIKLITIPYTQFDNIEKILTKAI